MRRRGFSGPGGGQGAGRHRARGTLLTCHRTSERSLHNWAPAKSSPTHCWGQRPALGASSLWLDSGTPPLGSSPTSQSRARGGLISDTHLPGPWPPFPQLSSPLRLAPHLSLHAAPPEQLVSPRLHCPALPCPALPGVEVSPTQQIPHSTSSLPTAVCRARSACDSPFVDEKSAGLVQGSSSNMGRKRTESHSFIHSLSPFYGSDAILGDMTQ